LRFLFSGRLIKTQTQHVRIKASVVRNTAHKKMPLTLQLVLKNYYHALVYCDYYCDSGAKYNTSLLLRRLRRKGSYVRHSPREFKELFISQAFTLPSP